MSSLSYLNYVIADVECRNVAVEQVVGRYRLIFELSFDLKNWEGSGQLRGHVPYMTGLRVVVKLTGAVVGTAFPKEEDFLPPVHPGILNAVPVSRSFALDIDPPTLDRIEQERSGQEVSFELEVLGTGTAFALRDANSQHASSLPEPLEIEPLLFKPLLAKANVYHQVPQSKWVELLDRMGYARILLYEIPWPESGENGISKAVSWFEAARAAFLSGSYTDAVGKLRESLDSACSAINCDKHADWQKVANQKSRRDMTLQERFLLAWNSVYHMTHPAHHGGSYSREEARYILGMGALALSLAATTPGVLRNTEGEAP